MKSACKVLPALLLVVAVFASRVHGQDAAEPSAEPSAIDAATASDATDAAPAEPEATDAEQASTTPQAAALSVIGDERLTVLDWAIVAGYFIILLLFAWWVIRKNKNTADDYFLAGRNLGWFVIGASIFASNIGSEHLVGLAGSGCTDGVAMAHYELHAWCLLVLAWILIPFYARSMVFTMPEFLEKRFSPTNRWVLSLISLVAYVLTKVAVGIFAGGIVFQVLLPELQLNLAGIELDSFWIGSILVVALTGLYTVIGGLRAVAYTEALQTVILIIGSALVTVYGLGALGELNGGDGSLAAGWANLSEIVGKDMFNLWKPLVPEGVEGTWAPVKTDTQIAWYFNDQYPWLGMLFCAPIIGLWYWCTDQYIVQRALGAPNEKEARRGSIFAAFLKLLPVFIFIIPGMICMALAVSQFEATYAQTPGAATETLDAEAKANRLALEGGEVRPAGDKFLSILDKDGKEIKENCQAAFPLMVKHALPPGIRGIVVAGLLSALMSSLAGVFNASSTLFTMDFYSKFRKGASQGELVWVGRIATAVVVLIGLAWIPVIKNAPKGLYDYLQTVQGYLAPPIFAVFIFGVFNKRLNAKGCLMALLVGFLLGAFRLAIDTPVALQDSLFAGAAFSNTDFYEPGSLYWIINKIYFQYYSLLIFLASTGVLFLVSYLTPRPDYQKIAGLTYGTVTEADRAASRKSWGIIDVIASIVIIGAIVAAYLYFSTLIAAK